ncbi:MAG TPA: LPS assembly lipoprotein LptE [Burkholderiales bacterium]|nr:LPS assembly lipoprotein LptE [Burkholderiales bacterium]
MRAIPAFAFTLLLAALLPACGFQLRGTADLPFKTIYIPPTNTAGVALDLRRNIRAGTHTTVVDDPKQAEAVIEFTQEAREKVILSLAANGRVREYQLRYRVGFRVHDNKGGEFLPVSAIQLSRDITFNDSDVLSKDAEEQLLYRDMQFDMVQQIMRRLETAKRPKPEAS